MEEAEELKEEGKMKKLLIIFALILAPGLFTAPAVLAANYAADYLEGGNPGGWTASSKTFDDAAGIHVSVGDTFDVDIWMRECPGSATNGGFWINYEASLVQITAVDAYDGADLPGPWTSGNTGKIPNPTGNSPADSYAITLANLAGAVPDGLNDLIIARVTFECIAAGESAVQVETVHSYDTWAPGPPWYYALIEPGNFTISSNSMPVTTTSVSISTTSAPGTTSSSSTPTTIIPITTTTSFTTTIPTRLLPCLVEKIYGENSEQVELLRNLRDNTLRKIPVGREIIKLYYQWSPAIVRAIEGDDEFKEQMRHIIDRILLLR